MNVRQRRYLVASLKSLSVLVAASYVALLVLGRFLAPGPGLSAILFSPLTLGSLILAGGAPLWLAHYLSLSDDLAAPVDVASLPQPPTIRQDCPEWPTILAWLVTDLKDEDAQRVGSHVSACDTCRRRLALMSAVHEMRSDEGR